MEKTHYAVEARLESTHWWFRGRRKLLSAIIVELGLPSDAPILDIGTSTGPNLRMLKTLGFHNITGIDKSPRAVRFCAKKGLGKVLLGDICRLPFDDGSFQLVLATDILEHVEDDLLALRQIHRVLAPGGTVLITTPAFKCIWGMQDDISHHKRRYLIRPLVQRLKQAGFISRESFYFNYLLFFPIWATRHLIRILGIRLKSENQINTRLLNRAFSRLFAFDVWSARRLKPPVGVSAFVMAQKAP